MNMETDKKEFLDKLNIIKENINQLESRFKDEKENSSDDGDGDGDVEMKDFISNSIINTLMEKIDLDDDEYSSSISIGSNEGSEFKTISDKFLVGINSEKIFDNNNNDDDDEDRYHLEYLPCGEKIELFYNKKFSKKNEEFIIFNTDECEVYENEYLRTLFRKSKYWKVYPFIEYNSDGTVGKQNMILDNFRLINTCGNKQNIIDLKDVNFI